MQIYAFTDEAGAYIGDQIDAMKRNNLTGMEPRTIDGVSVSELSFSQAAFIRKIMDDNGFSIWSVGSPIGKVYPDNESFGADCERLKHTLEVAHILGAECIRMFSFYIPNGEDASLYRNQVLEYLCKYAEIAADTGVKLCHENEKGIYGDKAERCLEIFKTVPEIKGVFDPANFVQCHQETLSAWEMLKPYICYMHIKDALQDGTVVLPGKGEGNVLKIVRKYIAQGGHIFTIEPHLVSFGALCTLEKSGNRSVIDDSGLLKSSGEAFDLACRTFKEMVSEYKL